MKIYGLHKAKLQEIAEQMGIELYQVTEGGKRKPYISCLLRPKSGSDTYRKVSNQGRRVWAVSWIGHRDFMRAVFRSNCDAEIRTCVITYRGSDNFEQTFESTGNRNIGSIVQPLNFRDDSYESERI